MLKFNLNVESEIDRNIVLTSFLVSDKYIEEEKKVVFALMKNSGLFSEYLCLHTGDGFLSADFVSGSGFPYSVQANKMSVSDVNLFLKKEVEHRKKKQMGQSLISSVSNLESKSLGMLRDDVMKVVSTFSSVKEVEHFFDVKEFYLKRKEAPLGILTGIKAFDDITRGLEYGTTSVFFGYVSHSKCLNEETLVPTNKGYITLKEMQEESELEVDSGIEKGKVSAQHCIGKVESIKVETEGGYGLEGRAEHRCYVLDNNFKLRWKRLDELKKGDLVTIRCGSSVYSNKKEVTNKDSYVLGLFCGEGGMVGREAGKERRKYRRLSFCNTDKDLVHKVRDVFSRISKREIKVYKRKSRKLGHKEQFDVGVMNEDVYDFFVDVRERSENKKVPKKIRKSCKEVMAYFLRGLFDADGTVECVLDARVELSTNSEILKTQVQGVLLNMGIRSKSYLRKKDWVVQIRNLNVRVFEKEIGFGLAEKRKKLKIAAKKVKGFNQQIPYKDFVINLLVDEKPKDRAWYKENSTLWQVKRGQTKGLCKHSVEKIEWKGKVNTVFDMFMEGKIFFEAVKKTKKGVCYCRDLSVGETEIYNAAGFITHNTTMLLNIMYQALVHGFNVVYVTLEVPKILMYYALLSLHSYMISVKTGKHPVLYIDMVKGELKDDVEKYVFGEVESSIMKMPGKFVFVEQDGIEDYSHAGMEGFCRSLPFKVDVVFVDYVQLLLLYQKSRAGSRYEDSRLVHDFTRLAIGEGGQSKIVVLAAQANRDGYKRATENEGAYDLTAISDLSQLEKDSYYVFSLYLDDELRRSGEVKMCLLKNKSGPLVTQPIIVSVDPRFYALGDNIKGYNDPVTTSDIEKIVLDYSLDDLLNK